MIATAPGKLILTGEYAVLHGAPALVVAMNRRVVARRRAGPLGSSAFLLALVDEVARRKGKDHPATRAAAEIVVDSGAFYEDGEKLGLGSSAAVTVAATALALAADHVAVPLIDREDVLAIASAAHAAAQGPRGSRGSGADIAAAVHGGLIAFQRTEADAAGGWHAKPLVLAGAESQPVMVHALGWPTGLTLIPFFTGTSADTPALVAAVEAARLRDPSGVDAAFSAIDQASRAACQACAMRVSEIASNALIAALALGASAMDRLATATGVPLVPSCVTAARTAIGKHLRGTAKTTGAGGGDIGIAVVPSTEDVTEAKRLLIESGCQPLAMTVDTTGVDLQPDAQ